MKLGEFKFGFLVAGSHNNESYHEQFFFASRCFLSKDVSNWDKTLRSFWETENISEEKHVISDKFKSCEDNFERTRVRKPLGRYSVSLPFKENIQKNINLGDSTTIASKRLEQLSRRLNHDPKLMFPYTQFKEEYLSLFHMGEVLNIDKITSDDPSHHGVLSLEFDNLETLSPGHFIIGRPITAILEKQ
ncbi:DUF1758 domain-containing protein [Nephila pilipes]|uniref:DUF1758 domain-containing protein n=1 Tax=Nephila pilipes TaxID=299642 RepID=A0A8X6N520_NEPPI|nr:DUF1758 domain-containing protein [Nephila pilipes]